MNEIDSPVIAEYVNGNYRVTIHEDGSKVRENDLDHFDADFPENADIKITNACGSQGHAKTLCSWCHEDSRPDGKHADLSQPFFDTFHTGTEMALGGGNPLEHPDLDDFLRRMRDRGVLCNLTVHIKHATDAHARLERYLGEKLIRGLGISVQKADKRMMPILQMHPNIVCHVISGILTLPDLDVLANNNLKLLILGYKDVRRGAAFHNKEVDRNIKMLYDKLDATLSLFKVVCFDNLALEQLSVRRLLTEDEWKVCYQGSDGSFTMYVDAVERKYAKSSTDPRLFDVSDSIDKMFAHVKTLD